MGGEGGRKEEGGEEEEEVEVTANSTELCDHFKQETWETRGQLDLPQYE